MQEYYLSEVEEKSIVSGKSLDEGLHVAFQQAVEAHRRLNYIYAEYAESNPDALRRLELESSVDHISESLANEEKYVNDMAKVLLNIYVSNGLVRIEP